METPLRTSALPVWLLDPVEPTVEAATHGEYRLEASQRTWLFPVLGGLVLLALSVVGWITDPKQFYFSYLVGWAFCVALSLGSLFFVMIHHLTRSHWAVVVRRIAEAAAMSFPLLAVLSIPIFIGMHDLFHWTHEDLYDPASPHYDEILAGKRSYLNTPFFIARMVAYFAVWILLSWKLYRLSLRQDVDPDHSIPAKQRWWSALGIPLFAVTLAFGSYDFLMSLDPHWFSTIFGV
ncbi:MAG TPA: hypothetical protein VD948_02115, partial [Rhodothermales bacterium]|nr:hypothetical protein [Rhodothermales bacterium]